MSEEEQSPAASVGQVRLRFGAALQDPILSARRYRVLKKLGAGSFGTVLLAWCERRKYITLLPLTLLVHCALYMHVSMVAICVCCMLYVVCCVLCCRRLVAVKVQSKSRSSLCNSVDQSRFMRREVAALSEQHHENVLEWLHTVETCTDLYVVMEFCPGGTLLRAIENSPLAGLPERDAKRIAAQILSALVYLHRKSITVVYFLDFPIHI